MEEIPSRNLYKIRTDWNRTEWQTFNCLLWNQFFTVLHKTIIVIFCWLFYWTLKLLKWTTGPKTSFPQEETGVSPYKTSTCAMFSSVFPTNPSPSPPLLSSLFDWSVYSMVTQWFARGLTFCTLCCLQIANVSPLQAVCCGVSNQKHKNPLQKHSRL